MNTQDPAAMFVGYVNEQTAAARASVIGEVEDFLAMLKSGQTRPSVQKVDESRRDGAPRNFVSEIISFHGLKNGNREGKWSLPASNVARISTAELGLTSRAFNALERGRIGSVADITALPLSKIAQLSDLGSLCYLELCVILLQLGLSQEEVPIAAT